MEKNVIKTIREAFKIAYSNKLIKESSIKMAKKMDPNEFNKAEALYPRWISGNLPGLTFGKAEGLSDLAQNYLVEKAVEEFKDTKSKKTHDAIITFYYPYEKSKTFNSIKKGTYGYGSAIIQNLKQKSGDKGWEDGFAENILTAFATSIADPIAFDKIINTYDPSTSTSASQHILYKLAEQMSSVAADTKGTAKGGGAKTQSLDEPGYDSEGGRKMDLPGGIEISDKAANIKQMYNLFQDFGNMTADYFEDKGKEDFAVLAREFFVNGKSYAEIKELYPEYFKDVEQSEMSGNKMLQGVLRPEIVKKFAKLIGKQKGFPENWLENLIKSKNISSIQDAYKDVEPETETDMPISKKEKRTSGMVFEKFINSNMDAIIQEVYKRLNENTEDYEEYSIADDDEIDGKYCKDFKVSELNPGDVIYMRLIDAEDYEHQWAKDINNLNPIGTAQYFQPESFEVIEIGDDTIKLKGKSSDFFTISKKE